MRTDARWWLAGGFLVLSWWVHPAVREAGWGPVGCARTGGPPVFFPMQSAPQFMPSVAPRQQPRQNPPSLVRGAMPKEQSQPKAMALSIPTPEELGIRVRETTEQPCPKAVAATMSIPTPEEL